MGSGPILGPLSIPREPFEVLLPPPTCCPLHLSPFMLLGMREEWSLRWAHGGTKGECRGYIHIRVCSAVILEVPWKKPYLNFLILDSVTGFEQKRYKRVLMFCHFVTFLRDPESQADDDSQEIFKLAKDVLIQGLIDENLGLQYVLLPK